LGVCKSPCNEFTLTVFLSKLTTIWIYPVDVAKTVYQKQLLAARPGESAPKPVITFFQRHAYRGLGVSVLRSMIINMIFFSNFEFVKKQINALEVD